MGCLKRYDSVQDILKEFFELRLHYYKLRKDWLVGSLGAEAAKLSNQARFVLEKIEGKVTIGKNTKVCSSLSSHVILMMFFFSFFLTIYSHFIGIFRNVVYKFNYVLILILCLLACSLTENKSKKDLIRMLVQKGYESDPVIAWNKAQEKVKHF